MKIDSLPPEVEKELAPIRKAVDGLRASAGNYKRPEVLRPSDPEVLAVAEEQGQAMKELMKLGFNSLGSAGDRRKTGSLVVSHWFVHEDATTCGWLGFLKTKIGSVPVVFLITEASGPAYCTAKQGGPSLSLARPPNVNHADHDVGASVADALRDHRERVNLLMASGGRLTKVANIGDAIEVIARLNQNRSDWRASVDEYELLRADLIAVLADVARDLSPVAFSLIYGHAAQWLDFHATRAIPSENATHNFGARESKGMEFPHIVVARLYEHIEPIERGNRYEDPLHALLERSQRGRVTGGGSQLNELGGIQYADLDIDLANLDDALGLVITALEKAGAPQGSEIVHEGKVLREFGTQQCLAIYLDGTSLPAEVYANLDFEQVVHDIGAAAGAGSYRGYWQGPRETAAYFFGPNAEEMFKRVEGLLLEMPTGQNARVVLRHGKQSLNPREVRMPRR